MSGLRGLAAPLYAHPVLAASLWSRLPDTDWGDGFLVVNVADGPGAQVDAAYSGAVAALRAADLPVLGYLDAGYGDRRRSALLADSRRWRSHYGIDSFFVDRVPAGPAHHAQVDDLVERLRPRDTQRVVLNPGVVPAPGFNRTADLVVTFEGSWQQYRRRGSSECQVGIAAERVCHLVYGVPRAVPVGTVLRRAVGCGAAVLGASRGRMPNPWTESVV